MLACAHKDDKTTSNTEEGLVSAMWVDVYENEVVHSSHSGTMQYVYGWRRKLRSYEDQGDNEIDVARRWLQGPTSSPIPLRRPG